MALDKQVVGVNFTQGLDTQTDKRVVLPGKMISLQNATMSEADTFKRRNGNTVIATGTGISGLALHDNALLAVDFQNLKSYSPAMGAMTSAGTISTVTMGLDELVHTTGTQALWDVATLGTMTCYVWVDYLADGTLNGCKYMVVDETSGDVLVSPTLIDGATSYNPRVVALTAGFLLIYGSTAATIKGRVVPATAPTTIGTAATFVTDFSPATPVMDAISISPGANNNAYVYYVSDGTSANSTKIFSISVTGTTPSVSHGPTVVTTDAQLSRANTIGMAIAAFDSSTLLVAALANAAAAAGAGMWTAVFNTSATVLHAAALQDATAAPTGNYGAITAVLSATGMWVYSDDAGSIGAAAGTKLIRRTCINSLNAAVVASATWALSAVRPNGTNGPFIASKAFADGSTIYIPTFIQEAGTGTLQNSWFLMHADTAQAVGRALYGTWGKVPTGAINYMQSSAPTLSSGEVVAVVREVLQLSFNSVGVPITTTGLNRLRLSFGNQMVHGQIGRSTYFANGVLSMFDNLAATEAGFNLFPEVVSAAQGAAGGVVTAGAHLIVAVYEWYDAAGQRHQSAPSVAITYTAADAVHHCTVTVPTLFLSKKTGINIGVYASQAGGTVLYRVNGITSPAANSTTAATIAVDYNVADANLSAGEILYTQGGTLPNNAPPPATALAIHQNRVFINPSDDPFAFQYSQQWVSGFGLQWNEALQGRVESTGGGITAFASMDDKLIIFRPRRIGVLFGQGPDATGNQNGYSLVDLPVDVGCSEPRSVLVMPEGIIFKSTNKGWYRLGRDLQVAWIGEGVQEWDSQGVTSAVLLDTIRECRFTTEDDLTLVWHYQRQQWSTFANFRGVDAVWWPGGNAYIRALETQIFQELPPTTAGLAYGDSATDTLGAAGFANVVPQTGTVIPMIFQTGWLKPGDALQAFQRIWRVLLTGAVAGYAGGRAILASGNINDSFITVDSTDGWPSSGAANTLIIGWGNAAYALLGTTWTVTNATRIDLGAPLAATFAAGLVVTTTVTTQRAAGSMQVDFYYDGNDSAPAQTVTIADVSQLGNGNAWDVRLQPTQQKCDAIMLKVTSTPSVIDPGASLDFSGMTLEVGVKRGARKFSAAKTS